MDHGSNNSEEKNSKFWFNITNASGNYVNSIIGVGIVTLPKTIADGGIAFAFISSLICCLLIYYTSDIMVKAAVKLIPRTKKQIQTYSNLCQETIGEWSLYVISGLTFFMMFFAMCVYGILLRSQMKLIIEDFLGEIFKYDKLVLLAIMVPIFLLCIPRDIKILGYASIVSSFLVLLFMIVVVVRSPEYHNLMISLTPEKMIANEVKLGNERATWLCNKAVTNETLYQNITSKDFDIYKSNKYSKLYKHLISKPSVCADINARKVDERVASFTLNVTSFDEPESIIKINQPQSWTDVVSQAHSRHLYNIYKLDVNFKTDSTFMDKLYVLGIYSSAFIIQQATFGIYSSLLNPTLKNWRLVQTIGMITVYILCMGLALSGYLGQKHLVGETVFDKMKLRYYVEKASIDIAINCGRIALIITIILTFPMMHWFAKRNFNIVFFKLYGMKTKKDYDPTNPKAKFYYPITIFMFGLTLIFSLFVDDILLVYTLIGSILASPLIYIFPCLCYMSVDGSIIQHIVNTVRSRKPLKIILDVVLPITSITFGVFATIAGTTVSIIRHFVNKQ